AKANLDVTKAELAENRSKLKEASSRIELLEAQKADTADFLAKCYAQLRSLQDRVSTTFSSSCGGGGGGGGGSPRPSRGSSYAAASTSHASTEAPSTGCSTDEYAISISGERSRSGGSAATTTTTR
ncbi:unnamed protein product, partial [Laminaria digitata]